MASATTEKRELSQAEKSVQIAIDVIQREAHQLYEDADELSVLDETKRDLLTAEAKGMEAAARIMQARLDAGRFAASLLDIPA